MVITEIAGKVKKGTPLVLEPGQYFKTTILSEKYYGLYFCIVFDGTIFSLKDPRQTWILSEMATRFTTENTRILTTGDVLQLEF